MLDTSIIMIYYLYIIMIDGDVVKENTGKSKYVILGLLDHSPQTGYTIKKAIEYEYSHFWQESFGQIYPTLKSLEAEGLAVSAEGEAGGGRGQIVYSITDGGRAELMKWLSEAPDVERLRYELLLKVSFGASAAPEAILAQLDNFIARNERNISELRGFAGLFESLKAQGQEHTGNELTTLCGIYVYSAFRDWALEAKKIIMEREINRHETKNS